MRLNHGQLRKVTNLLVLWGRTVGVHTCVTAQAPACRHVNVGGCVNVWVVGGRTQEPGHRRGPQPFPQPHFTSSKVRTTKPALRPGPEAIDSGGPQRQAKKGETQGAKEAPAEQSVGHTHSLGVQPPVPPLVEGRMGVPEAWAGLAHHWLLESHPETPRTTPPCGRWPLGLRSCPIGRKAGGGAGSIPAGIPAVVPTCSRVPVWLPSSCPQ